MSNKSNLEVDYKEIELVKLSIIICAHNEYGNLKRWKSNIEKCSDERINFIIKDSGVCEDSKDLFKNNNLPNLLFITSLDTGLYNALNQAIAKSSEYYLVAGADDELYFDNLSFVLDQIDPSTDIVLGAVKTGLTQKRSRNNKIPKHSLSGVVSSHSVGVIIRKKLHDYYGLYNEELVILSDLEFLVLVLRDSRTQKIFMPVVLGEFSTGGISSRISFTRIVEAFKVLWKVRHYRPYQPLILILRILKLLITRGMKI